ncbi:eukaryotic translation initiation factor 3 subunit M-like [Liolophura sinensis]|uniref:eukaryotic translation initiation factor 3 subunit M-like n=1 Tax=Liolophura sinensis TaxID=3198878 RepID=UPI00315808FA
MSVPAFIDLDIPDQTSELRSYLKSLGAEISEENTEAGLVTDLKNIIEASTVCWKEIKDDADVEMVFNGIISLMVFVPAEKAEEVITLFCEKVGKAPQGEKRGHVRIKLLLNLLGIDESSPNRYTVYCSLVRLGGQTDLLHLVPTDLEKIKLWIEKWELSTQKVQHLLRTVHGAFQETKMSENATKVMIELLGTYTEDNASQARDDAHRCIVTCLADPNTYLMDHLLTLKPVKFLEGELIHDLLTIFVSGKLTQYLQFYKNNTDFVTSLGLSHEQNLKKMRLLTFMQLAEGKKEVEFEQIQKEMELNEDDVEDFIIEILKTKSVRAKIDQTQKKVIISYTTQRTFGRQHWQMLRQYLEEWHSNLEAVRNSLQTLAMMPTGPAAQ